MCCTISAKQFCYNRDHFFDDGLCRIEAEIKIQFVAPWMPRIKFIILGALFINPGNFLPEFFIGERFLLRAFFTAALYLAFHVCIDKNSERLIFFQNVICAASNDDAV